MNGEANREANYVNHIHLLFLRVSYDTLPPTNDEVRENYLLNFILL